MGYRLWDLEARKIVHSHDVISNDPKMHKKAKKTIGIHKVVFQEVDVCHM